MSPEFANLLTRHIGNAFAKQLAFAELISERNWGVRIAEGRATFGDDLTYAIQLLGTEAEGDSSWLWAWANAGSNLPPDVLRVCSELKAFGEKKGVPELIEPSYSLETANGHMIAMVASGLRSECCYYRGPYDGGALYFLVCDVPSEVTQHVALERAITVLTEVISQFEVDHREMAGSFLQAQGFDIESSGKTMAATRGEQSIELSFDVLNRIDNIQGTLGPPKPLKKSWWQFW